MLNVIMLSVVMPSLLAPSLDFLWWLSYVFFATFFLMATEVAGGIKPFNLLL
jgi:hypothetical protein